MTAVLERPPLYLRPVELGRRATGFLLGLGIKAYGAAAAVSVTLSDAETMGGKSYDALNAVPNLMERYRQAKYVVDHRAEIQAALDYVHQRAPDPKQLEAAATESAETLNRITATHREVTQAWDALASIRPHNVLERFPRAKEHFGRAWAAKPDLDSIGNLADEAQDVTSFLRQLEGLNIDLAGLYATLLNVMDNFASDEISSTLGVMGAAIGVAYALGTGAGFWGRRGRPGFMASTLHGWGARRFRSWYVLNLEHALGRRLYAVARQRIQSDIVADPHKALDPVALQELEQYFERRLREREGVAGAGVGGRGSQRVSEGPWPNDFSSRGTDGRTG
jgi:hypothetical protein